MNQLRLAARALTDRRLIVSILVFAYSEIAVPIIRNSKKLEFTLNYRLSASLLLSNSLPRYLSQCCQ